MITVRRAAVAALCLAFSVHAGAQHLHLGAEQLVEAGGADIGVPGYSVPSTADWNNDGLEDLIVGEGSGTATPKVRVYLNFGTAADPQFSTFFYAQSEGADLTVTGGGCLGLSPRVVYWDADSRKDLLVGLADGTVRVYLNNNTGDDPEFDGGDFLQAGPTGYKTNIGVGSRATPTVADWNNDGRKDLIVGALDGKIRIYLNEGTDTEPDFVGQTSAQDGGADLVVPSGRSSPVVRDLDNDGNKDILTGNTNGQLLLYSNAGTDVAPSFSGYVAIEADGVPIDLSSTRSRPFVCDWGDDGRLDVLIGSSDGLVRLFPSVLGDMNCDGTLDSFDIDAFVLALASASNILPFDEYYDVYASCDGMRADVNGDGSVNNFDIDPFVLLLS